MKLAVFSSKAYDKKYLEGVLTAKYSGMCELVFHSFALSEETVSLAQGCQAVCVFVNDILDKPVLEALHNYGVDGILLRCAGYNNVDLVTAEELGMFVANVPSYSPEAVAEFAVALLQTLNRRIHHAYNRVREGNFNLEGLLGQTFHGKTVGVIGVGRIGLALARIFKGFGCKLLAYDPFRNPDFEQLGEFADLEDVLARSDIVSLHCPLTPETHHIINEKTLSKIKEGALLVNTSRGALIDTKAVIEALKKKRLSGLALDVYEAEGTLFYNDHSGDIIDDDELMRLMTFPNVIVCGHQAFFTHEALSEIAETTMSNMFSYVTKKPTSNSLVRQGNILVRADSLPVRM